MSNELDYVLVPSVGGGYTKMERATAIDTNQNYVEVPTNGTPRAMINPTYSGGIWTDTVATQAALSSIEKQLTATGQDIASQAAMALQALALAVAGNVKITPITNWADRIRNYRTLSNLGGWTDDQVASAVTVTWITANDYASITGKSYVAGGAS